MKNFLPKLRPWAGFRTGTGQPSRYFLLAPIWCTALLFLLITGFSAAVAQVINGNDTGAGSLRDAVANAAPGATITFSGVTTVTLTSGELLINKNLTIDGGTDGVTITRSGATQFRIFNISSGTVALTKLTVNNGSHATQAGGIQNNGTLTLTNCAITGNTAPQAGGVQNDATITITGCTFSSNIGNNSGFSGGGFVNFGTLANLTNCTFSGNDTAGSGGGIYVGTGTVNVTNCTLANNDSSRGGGIYIETGATVTLKNTIVINNTANLVGTKNIGLTVNSASSYNLIGNDGLGGLTNGVNGNQVGVTGPLLNSLANNGGYTQTISLQLGSPALDKGAAVAGLTTDQRGQQRPYDAVNIAAASGGNNSDIGAYEENPTCSPVTVDPASLPNGTVGSPYIQTFTATGGNTAYGYAITAGSLPAGLYLAADGTLSGQPITTGTSNFTVTAAYGFGCPGSRAYSITIASCGVSTSYTVNNTGDGADASPGNGVCETAAGNGVCTLRAAIQEINALPSCSNSINFSGVTGTIQLSSALPDLAATFTINGPGANLLTVRRNSGTFRIFNIPLVGAATISGLTISNGSADEGGGIRNAARLTVTDCALTGNQSKGTNAGGTAGKTGGGGAIFTDATGTTIVTRSLLNSNTATGGNGEFANGGGGGGGGLGGALFNNGGSLTVTNTTITNNTATGGNGGQANTLCPGGPGGKGGGNGGQSGSINGGFGGGGSGGSNSTSPGIGGRFGGNGGNGAGGGCTSAAGTGGSAAGGALFNYGGTSTLANVTIINNTATAGNNGAAASRGGGLYNEAGTLTVKNSIIAGNSAQTTGTEDCDNNSIPITTNGYNLFGSSTGCPTGGLQDQTVAAANLFTTVLSSLGYYGGTTQVYLPLSGSPVIDKGSAVAGITVDQRNKTRPIDQSGVSSAPGGNGSDIGAVESQSCTTVAISPNSLTDINIGSTYSQTFTGSGGTSPYGFAITAGTLPTGLTLSLAGTLSGTPTALGASTFTITMSDDNGCFTSQSYTVNVICPTVTIDQTSLPNTVQGATYSQTLTVTGGTGTTAWTSGSGALPNGLTLASSSGLLSGTPSATNSFTFTVTATRQYGCSGSRQYTVIVSPCVNTFTVNSLGDDADAAPGNGICETATGNGVCTLRAAIQEANALPGCAPHTLTVGSGIITLNTALPDLNANMTINGPGSNLLTVRRNSADGTPTFTVITISSGRTITLNGMTISNGKNTIGAGVRNNGTLTIDGCAITGNTAYSLGAGFSALSRGGGIFQSGSSTSLMLINSTVSGNQSIAESPDASAADAQGGGIQRTSGSITVINSTISGNTATSIGSSGTARGGGFYLSSSGTLTVTNTTISNNSASGGAAANEGGGVYRDPSATGAANFKNTIIAGNNAATGNDIFGTLVSQGFNLIGKSDGGTGFTDGMNNDLVGSIATPKKALLASLGNYGGSTLTHALLPGSPAINAGTATGAPTTDQRGTVRPQQSLLDIGSFESQGFTLSVGGGSGQTAIVNTDFANPLIVAVAPVVVGEPVDGGEITFAPPGSGASATLLYNPATISSGSASGGTVTANGSIGGPYTIAASSIGSVSSVNFQLTNTTSNTAPTITATSSVSRQQGSAVINSPIATVNDVESSAAGVTVTVTNANPSNGVTLSNIVNTNGTITADIIASCTATDAVFTLQANDGNSTATASLSITVTANTAPTLSYNNASVNFGNTATINPATGPSDNGSISSIAVQSVSPPIAPITLTVDNATGIVSVPNNVPAGSYTVTIRATDNCGTFTDATFTLNVQSADYIISTTGNAIIITDAAGNGETLALSENGTNINFAAPGRTYSLNGGNVTNLPADVSLSGVNSITINTAAGNDIIDMGAFPNNQLPDLTINGGTGDDNVNFNGDITFAINKQLDLDLQNDAVNPGTDVVYIADNANILLSGTGAVIVKVSKNLSVNSGGSIETANGNLTVEANQQSTPTTGSFRGVDVFGGVLQTTGTGIISIKGKGGDDPATGQQHGVFVRVGGKIMGGSSSVTVIGTGGASTAGANHGVYVTGTNSLISSTGGDVSITGTGGGTSVSSSVNAGVALNTGGQISAGGTGKVTVNGTGGNNLPLSNYGVYVFNATITSANGDVNIIGLGGGTGTRDNNHGVLIANSGKITAGGTGKVTISATGGSTSGSNNHGFYVNGANSMLSSSGGDISITATAGSTNSNAVRLITNGSVTTATNGGNITLIGDDMNLAAGSVSAGSNTVTLRPKTNAIAIDLGGADAAGSTLGLTDTELNNVTAGTIYIGDANSGNITVSNAISHAAGNLNLSTGGAVNLSVSSLNAGTGNINLTAAGGINSTATGVDISGVVHTFGSGNNLKLVINGTGSDTQYDQLNVVGTVNLAGLNLVLSTSNSFVPSPGQTFIIVNNDGSDAVLNTFNSLTQGAVIANFLGSSLNATISYEGGNGNDVVVTVNNTNPTIIAGGTLSRQQGSAGSSAIIATVSDTETAAGNLTVTATTVPAGITVTNIATDNAGSVTASVTADCNAALGDNTVVLTVTDANSGTATANLTVNVTANTAPTLTYGNASVNFGNAATINPATSPSDNGSISSIIVQNVSSSTAPGTITVDNSTGIVSVPNNVPAGNYTVTIRATDNCTLTTDASFTLNVQSADYTITTTGGHLILTDVAGSGETLTISQSNSTNIQFNVPTKTYSLNGAGVTAFPYAFPISSLADVSVNTANGDDVINVGAFSINLPSLTLRGGTGDDLINFNGDITFVSNAHLDVDMQSDPTPIGNDAVNIASGANLLLSGTGTATVKASKNVLINGSLETVDGNLLVEANQQAIPTAGSFKGILVYGAGSMIRTTGNGLLTLKGKGGNSSTNQRGVQIENDGKIIGGTGTVSVTGIGGASSGDDNWGVTVTNSSSAITSTGGNINISGTGGGTGISSQNIGVIAFVGQISAGGSGTVTVMGYGGTASSGNGNVGVYVQGGAITSSGGNVSVNGTGGGAGGSNHNEGIVVLSGQISAGGSGTVSVTGNGGTTSSGNSNFGVSVNGTGGGGTITSSGGNVSVTGTGGGAGAGGSNSGVTVTNAGQITAGGSGTVTVTGNGSTTSLGNFNIGVTLSTNGAAITSSGGNVSVIGTGGGTGSNTNNTGVALGTGGQIKAGSNGTVSVTGYGGTTSSGTSNNGVSVDGNGAIITSSGGEVSITGVEGNGTNNVGIIIKSSSSVSTSTNGGNLNLIANSMDITAPVSTNTGSILRMRPFTNNTPIDLGTESVGSLSLTDTELDLISVGTLRIGETTGGNLTVSADITRTNATHISLLNNGDVTFSNGGINTNGGNLLLDLGTTSAAVKPNFIGTDATAGTLTLNSDLTIAVNGTTPGSQYQQLTVVGTLTLTGKELKFSGSHTPTPGQSFIIVDNDGSEAISGTFNGLMQGATISNFLNSGLNSTISYEGGNGNDVVVTVNNTNPTIIAGGTLSRQQGSAGSSATIATVSDTETAAGNLTVTATTVPAGITVTNIATDNAGSVTASVTADCNAALGDNMVVLTVTDANSGTATANLIVNVTANTAPTLTYGNASVNAAASTTNNPTTATDNGSITGYVVQSQGTYTGTISVNASGVVSISSAAPVGTHTITIRATDNCNAVTDATFTLNVGNNNPTIIAGATAIRQQGSAGAIATIATVSDSETSAGSLTVTATTLPTGITVTDITTNNAGSVTATVTANCNATVGNNTVVMTVTDGNSGTATANLTVNVTANSAPVLTYATASVSAGASTTNSPTTATENGSITGYIVQNPGTFTGTVTINASGVVSISNAAPVGSHTITIRATDNCGLTTDATFTLTIGCPTITIDNPTSLSVGTAGTTYSPVQFTQTGSSGSVVWSVSSNNLPAGLTLNPSSGQLSGTPSVATGVNITIRATDVNNCYGERIYTLQINCPTITLSPTSGSPTTLTDGTVQQAYSQFFTATSVGENYSYSIPVAAIPPGLQFNTATGELSGTPTTTGTFGFTVTATGFGTCTGQQSYSLTVNCQTITINPFSLPGGSTGVNYNQQLSASSASGTTNFTLESGTLPANVTMSPAGLLSGTPTAANTYTFIVKATDANLCIATKEYSVTIVASNTQPTITATAATRQAGSSVSNSAIATVNDVESGPGGVTVTVTSANPSNGVTVSNIVNTNGHIIADIIAACGATDASFTLTASDGGLSATATLNVTVTANTAPTLTYGTASVNAGSSTTNSPTAATDNGSISGYSVQNQGTYTGTITVNASGVVSISSAAPVGSHTITIRAIDNCGATTDATFTLNVGNNNPSITAGTTATRQRGSAGSSATIATVNDSETAAGSLTVTATTVPAGITVTGISNNSGTVTATITADCNATVGNNTIVLTVTDANSGTATANLTVNVTANTAPTLTYTNLSVNAGASNANSPTTATDNGSISSYSVQSFGTYSGTITINASGVVSISNAAPVGSHTITIRATDNCGATTDAAFTLTVDGCIPPTLSVSGKTNPTACGSSNGSLTFTTMGLPNGSYTLSYSESSAKTATITVDNNQFTLSGLKAGSYTNFSITRETCTGNDATTQTLSDPAAPNAGTISGAQPICGTSTLQLTTNGDAGGVWSSSDARIATVSPMTGAVTGVGSGQVQIFYRVINGECSSSTSALIRVNALPTLTATGTLLPSSRCPSLESVPLSSTVNCGGGKAVVWYNTSTEGNPILLPNQTPITSVDYYAACKDLATQCESSERLKVSFIALPAGSTPANVSLTADGTQVNAGQSAIFCDLPGNTLTFSNACRSGEQLLISVDGASYTSVVPLQIVDGALHNYRVRCQAGMGIEACLGAESNPMSLRIYPIPAKPTVSLSPQSICSTAPSVAFIGSSSCGNAATLWFDATTNQSLSLPAQTPLTTTSYYAKCQAAGGCLSEPSNIVTFTVLPVHDAPIVTNSVSDELCTGASALLTTNCPAGSTVLWNTTFVGSTLTVSFASPHSESYSAKCLLNGCETPMSQPKTISWNSFALTIINIGQSKSGIKEGDIITKADWNSQFVTADAGPTLEKSTSLNPTLYYTESPNKGGPRYWTIHSETCALGTEGSVTYDMLATPEVGVPQSFNTHENNAPYLMYANREGFRELYAQNHPAYGFYQDNGSGGNTYDAGLPKGLYKLSIRYWDQKGQGSIYPSTRQPAGNVLAYQEYWFRIQSQNGVGTGAARMALNNDQLSDRRTAMNNVQWTQVMPNPVSDILHLKVTDIKGQKVNVSLVDASGRTLLQRVFVPQTNAHQEEFEVSDLANGMYFIRINTADKQTTLKVIKIE